MKPDNNIKVSVLIPAFNEEKYIIATLNALLEQSYTNFEVIVIDNASTDSTAELVKGFIEKTNAERPFVKLISETRRGTNFARERGRKAATGYVIAQLDADCIPSKNWIKKGVNLLSKKGVVAVSGPYDYYDASPVRRWLTLIGQVIFYPLVNSVVQTLKRGGLLIGGNTFVYAFIMEKIGGYNTDLTFYGDDIEIAARVITYGFVTYSNQLILKTSSRRFTALGFNAVQKKYRKSFADLVLYKKIDITKSYEMMHPR